MYLLIILEILYLIKKKTQKEPRNPENLEQMHIIIFHEILSDLKNVS